MQCSCGAQQHSVTLSNLLKGKSTRCDTCAKKATKAYRRRYFCYADALGDDEIRTRLLNRLSAAMSRCNNPKNKLYRNYGGRGIQVCPEWEQDKRSFLNHAKTLDGFDDANLEMDRIDNDKGYERGNIRFISKADNNRNRRKISEMQQRIDGLEQRLRHCKCGAAKQIHD